MSANLVVDLANTCNYPPSLSLAAGVGNVPASGTLVGQIVDLKDANSMCQVWATAGPNSGVLVLKIETAGDASGLLQSGGGFPISGSFTDPTSGLPDFSQSIVKSGGLIYINSGLVSLPFGGGASGTMNVNTFAAGTHVSFNGQHGTGFAASGNFPVFCSGGFATASFLRPHRYARLVALSGGFTAQVVAGFLSSDKVTGSGGGFTYAPLTGTVNV